jgi:signal transduction histidine kinase
MAKHITAGSMTNMTYFMLFSALVLLVCAGMGADIGKTAQTEEVMQIMHWDEITNKEINDMWLRHLPLLLLNFALLICGAAMMLIALLSRKQWSLSRQRYWAEYAYLWHLGLFLIVLYGWILCHGEIVYLIFPRADMIELFRDLMYLLLLPMFLPHFRQIFVRDRRWIIDILFLIMVVFYFIAYGLYCFGIATFLETKPFLNTILFISVVWILVFFVFLKKTREQPAWGERFMAFLTIVCAIVLYWPAERIFGFTGNDYRAILLSVGFLIYCIFITAITTEKATCRVNEIAETNEQLLQSKLSLMLGQIRAHFIFNVLNSISTLCISDPYQAQSVIKRFSDYLRHNINALEQKGNLPFERELEFIKSYVDLEILRFGKQLKVIYDIQTKGFTIPLLTIQPIVENAIRHGIRNKREGGTVWIKTWKDKEHFYVEVQDNGVGFAYTNQQPKSHKSIALENISMRLKRIANGGLLISDREGGGASVKVILPICRKEEALL